MRIISRYSSYEMQTIKLLSMNTLVRVNSVSRECIKRNDLYSLTITVYFMNTDFNQGT